MRSALYVGTVGHRRHEPEHAFRYRQSLLYLDLDELETLVARSRLWSTRRRAPGRFLRSDYHGDASIPLGQALRDTVESRLGRRPTGPVRLLCRARTFGHVFNPVTFAYCFAEDGETLDAVVADVTNTPWNETHAYVLDHGRGTPAKAFHVSPLMGMEATYDVRCDVPGDELHVAISSSVGGRVQFDATLDLERRALSLDRALLRWPAESLRALLAIYTQALRLKLKGAKYFPKPEATT